MSLVFPSDAWVKALMEAMNASDNYAKAAANWEGDFAFIIEGDEADTYLYMDLWHGECRSARQLDAPGDESPAFTLKATYSRWQEVLTGKLDPIKGIMQRKLSLTGNMMKVIKAPKAAIAMVDCAKGLDTEWV